MNVLNLYSDQIIARKVSRTLNPGQITPALHFTVYPVINMRNKLFNRGQTPNPELL